jgi:predicted PurR-regulated permease PerM
MTDRPSHLPPQGAGPETIKRFRRKRSFKGAFLVLFATGLFALGYYLRPVITPFLFACLVAYVLNPVVNALEAKGLRRGTSILAVFGVLMIVATTTVLLFAPRVYSEINSLLVDTFHGEPYEDANFNGVYDPEDRFIPEEHDRNGNGTRDASNIDKLGEGLKQFVAQWNENNQKSPLQAEPIFHQIKDSLHDRFGEVAETGFNVGSWIVGTLISGISGFLSVIGYLVLVPLYVFFLLMDWDKLLQRSKAYLPPAYRDHIVSTADKINKANAAFFRGQTVISLTKGAIIMVSLLIFGIPYAILFGLLYAITNYVPFVGTIVSLCATILVTVISLGGFELWPLIFVGVSFAVCELTDTIVLTPLIHGKNTGLHPLVVILSVFIFSFLFGFFGMLLAIPLASATLIITGEWILPMVREFTGPIGNAPAE